MRCLCTPQDYSRCSESACPNKSAPDTDDEDELATCEACGAQVPTESLVGHVDVDLCASCDKSFIEHFVDCSHSWEFQQGDWGSGKHCNRCAGFVVDDISDVLFPLICDGWVPEDALVA